MAKPSVKAVVERDLNRLNQAQSEKDIDRALDHVVRILNADVSLVSLPKFRTALEAGAISKHFKEDLYSRLLGRLKISDSQWMKVESASQKWASLYENPNFDHLVQPLMQDLSEFFAFRIQSFPSKIGSLWDFRVSFPDIHLKYFDDDVHLILVADSRAGANEFRAIKEIIAKNDATTKVTLVLVVGNGSELRESAKTSSIEIVVLDEADCREILLSADSRRTFCHSIARRVSVQALQPYQTQGKVRSRMFYGRQGEIKRLKSNLSSSFAIYGGRLIGKSSLLHQIGEVFRCDESQTYRVCSITAQRSQPIELCRNILKSLGGLTGKHNSLLTFERLMRDDLVNHSKKVLILIDEVDDLIVADEESGYQLFDIFHNLNNDFGQRCRFVFAGYRDLARHCMDSNSRFRNFAEPLQLDTLDRVSARLLIQEPLCDELGFRFESDDHVTKIIEITGGHPNYIQVFCRELSEYLDGQQRRRIREPDIEYIANSANLRAQVVGTFYTNFSTLQQLITALVVLERKQHFDIPAVIDALDELGLELEVKEVYQALRLLEMSFVIGQDGTQYHFMHKLFPEMLAKAVDLDRLAVTLLRRLVEKRE